MPIPRPVLRIEDSNSTVGAFGQTYTFNCLNDGVEASSIAWTKDDGEIISTNNTSRVRVFTNNPAFELVLEISNAVLSDAGVYTCTAENTVGSDSTTASLACKTLHI